MNGESRNTWTIKLTWPYVAEQLDKITKQNGSLKQRIRRQISMVQITEMSIRNKIVRRNPVIIEIHHLEI